MLRKIAQTTTRVAAVTIAGLAPIYPSFSVASSTETVSPGDVWTYADIADLFGAAPIVLRAKIGSATVIKGAPTAAGATRFYVQGQVIVLIRGNQSVSPRLSWLVDVRPDSRGKLPKLGKADVLIAAQAVPGRPGEIQLVARDAQVAWSAALESRVRDVITQIAAPDAPPRVTGISSAFYSAGTIPGEGETQVFLSTANAAPISVTVLSRPGQPRTWALAQGEIVDEAAGPPARDTLAWYRLACFLPPALPATATSELSASDSGSARADYGFVIDALGTCPRMRHR